MYTHKHTSVICIISLTLHRMLIYIYIHHVLISYILCVSPYLYTDTWLYNLLNIQMHKGTITIWAKGCGTKHWAMYIRIMPIYGRMNLKNVYKYIVRMYMFVWVSVWCHECMNVWHMSVWVYACMNENITVTYDCMAVKVYEGMKVWRYECMV